MQAVFRRSDAGQTGSASWYANSVELAERGQAGNATQIHAAIKNADVDEVARLCRTGVDWKATDENGRTALDLAQHLCGQATDDAPLASRRAQVLNTLAWHGALSSQGSKAGGLTGSIAGVMAKLGALAGAGFLGAGITALKARIPVDDVDSASGPVMVRDAKEAFPYDDPSAEQLAAAAKLPTVPEAQQDFEFCRMKGAVSLMLEGGNCVDKYQRLHSSIVLRGQNDTIAALRDSSARHNAHQHKLGVATTAVGATTLGLVAAAAIGKWAANRWRAAPSANKASAPAPTVTVSVQAEDIEAARAAQAVHDEMHQRLAPARQLQSDHPQA